MRKKIILYTSFFVALIVAFWIVLSYIIPDFNKKIDLPILNTVKAFELIDQDGNIFTEKNIEGKICVVEYFFTTCHGICPRMNTNMKKIAHAFGGTENFMILSHTVDPETDSAGRLKIYADSIHANTTYWKFLTGSKEKLYTIARNSYLLDDPKNNVGSMQEQFIHTRFFSLVDNQGQVRGVYDGLKEAELEQLKKDIRTLLNQ